MSTLRERLQTALAKPLPDDEHAVSDETFDPWSDVIKGIHGQYALACDDLMIEALEAVQSRRTFQFIDGNLLGEFALYVLSGHGLTEYGGSPRGGWPDPEIEDLFPVLIEKWKGYRKAVWKTA